MKIIEHDGQEWCVVPGDAPALSVGDVMRCAYRHEVIPRRSTVPLGWGVDRAAWAAWCARDPVMVPMDATVLGAFDAIAQRSRRKIRVEALRMRRPLRVDKGRSDALAVRYRESIAELQALLLGACRGNVSELARRTGLPRRTLHRRLSEAAKSSAASSAEDQAAPQRKAG